MGPARPCQQPEHRADRAADEHVEHAHLRQLPGGRRQLREHQGHQHGEQPLGPADPPHRPDGEGEQHPHGQHYGVDVRVGAHQGQCPGGQQRPGQCAREREPDGVPGRLQGGPGEAERGQHGPEAVRQRVDPRDEPRRRESQRDPHRVLEEHRTPPRVPAQPVPPQHRGRDGGVPETLGRHLHLGMPPAYNPVGRRPHRQRGIRDLQHGRVPAQHHRRKPGRLRGQGRQRGTR